MSAFQFGNPALEKAPLGFLLRKREGALVGSDGLLFSAQPPAQIRVRGVRGALLVAGDDGLVIAEQLMEGIKGSALAALAASLGTKLRRAMEGAGVGAGQFWHLQAEQGALLAVPADSGVLVVAVADPDVNVGLERQIVAISTRHGVLSRFTAYVAVDYHLMDNREPFLYKTADFGRTWTRISGDLPTGHPLDYVLTVAENPNRKGMLFAGTGRGFYYSLDDGAHWTRFTEGLPAAPVTWIVVAKPLHDVVLSTYGRGLYVLRDVTALEHKDRVADADGVRLYPPAAGFREGRSGQALFTFSLAQAPADSVRMEVLDAGGTVIRTLKARGRAGMNRVTWDLRHDGPRQVELRTTPPDNPHIWEEARFKGKDTRPIIHWGIQSPQRVGPISAPGKYQVRLSVGEVSQTQPFEVLRGTSLPSPDPDLIASTALQVRVRDAINETADLVNRIEAMRKQLEDQLKANAGNRDLESAIRELDRKLMDVELRLLSRTEMHSDDKWYVEAYKVYLNLVWLAGDVGTGASDLAGGADYRPTDQSVATFEWLRQELEAAKAAFSAVITNDVPAFNRATAGKLVPISDH